MSTESKFVLLVERVTEKCFQGRVPARECDVRFVAAMLTVFVPESTAQPVREYFASHLVEAIDCLRRSQTARWLA
jgi:hypothetical protein